MKRFKATQTRHLFLIGLVTVLMLACRRSPSEEHLRSIMVMDEINTHTWGEIQSMLKGMEAKIKEQGSRPRDVVHLRETQEVIAIFDSLLNRINRIQWTFTEHEQQPVRDPEVELQDLIALYHRLPKNERMLCNDPMSLDLDVEDLPWLYVNLTVMEAHVLDRGICYMDQQWSRVGTKDLSFDMVFQPPYSSDGTGVQMDPTLGDWTDESYEYILENPFKGAWLTPLSTFGVDVDVASYANVRRHLSAGVLPPKDAVRVEELVNYFQYDYPEPVGDDPVAIVTELGPCPWNSEHHLLRIGMKSRDLLQETSYEELPANNLVFLIDVSGSMDSALKLPMVKSSLKLLTEKLRPQDKVAIVVYAGGVGVVLDPTAGNEKAAILRAIDQLEAGGSTAGEAGIREAYELATQSLIPGGNNRVIIATDGDFNVGVSSEGGLQHLISSYRDTGIYLTVLGFGMGNYKDSMLQRLSNHGNGNYAYIDSFKEARNVFESGFMSTMYAVAKDVKVQIEFNPARVQAYRLLGYEDRLMSPEGFADDQVDAGDMGSGHTVTAFYEIIPVGLKSSFMAQQSSLKYQRPKLKGRSLDWATIKFRYKHPEHNKSAELISVVAGKVHSNSTRDFHLASAIIEFGLLLRESDYKSDANYSAVQNRLKKFQKGKEEIGKWQELSKLVQLAQGLTIPN